MHKSKVLRIVLIIVFFAICHLLFAISRSFAQDKIIAVVNSEVITKKDFDDFLNFVRMQLSKQYNGEELENKMNSVKQDLLNKLIEDKLILQEAKKDNIKIEESLVQARINEIKKNYASDAEFIQDLDSQGLTQADVESRAREQLLMTNVVDSNIRAKVVIRPDEVTNFYNNNTKEFIFPEQREFESIILENEDQAKSFAFELKSGKKLSDLSVQYPVTVNNLNAKKTELRKDIQEVVFKLGISEVSDPIKIDDKFYVFRLLNVTAPRQQSLSEAQDRIHNFLFQKKMQDDLKKWLVDLRAKSYIKLMQD